MCHLPPSLWLSFYFLPRDPCTSSQSHRSGPSVPVFPSTVISLSYLHKLFLLFDLDSNLILKFSSCIFLKRIVSLLDPLDTMLAVLVILLEAVQFFLLQKGTANLAHWVCKIICNRLSPTIWRQISSTEMQINGKESLQWLGREAETISSIR